MYACVGWCCVCEGRVDVMAFAYERLCVVCVHESQNVSGDVAVFVLMLLTVYSVVVRCVVVLAAYVGFVLFCVCCVEVKVPPAACE